MPFLSNLTSGEQMMQQGLATKDELEAYMLPILADRRAAPRDDLLTTLCTAAIDGEQMTDHEIKASSCCCWWRGAKQPTKHSRTCS